MLLWSAFVVDNVLRIELQQLQSGVSVKFLMVEETNSMVGYHLMAEGHSF